MGCTARQPGQPRVTAAPPPQMWARSAGIVGERVPTECTTVGCEVQGGGTGGKGCSVTTMGRGPSFPAPRGSPTPLSTLNSRNVQRAQALVHPACLKSRFSVRSSHSKIVAPGAQSPRAKGDPSHRSSPYPWLSTCVPDAVNRRPSPPQSLTFQRYWSGMNSRLP